MLSKTVPLYKVRQEAKALAILATDRIGANYAEMLYDIREELGKVYQEHGNLDGGMTFSNLAKHGLIDKINKDIETIVKKRTKEAALEIRNCLRKTVASSHDLTKLALEQEANKKIRGILKPEIVNAIVQNPISGLKLDERLAMNRVFTVSTIKEEINRGLIQGKRYKDIAKQIEHKTEMEAFKAVRIVRTESHRCLEAGKYESITNAAKQGVNLRKWWRNGDDERVRPGHNYMGDKYSRDKAIPFDEDFVNEKTGGKGPHPGELGVAEDDINCRCVMVVEIITDPDPKEEQGINKQLKKQREDLEAGKAAKEEAELKKADIEQKKLKVTIEELKLGVVKADLDAQAKEIAKELEQAEKLIDKNTIPGIDNLTIISGDVLKEESGTVKKMHYSQFYQVNVQDGPEAIEVHRSYMGTGYKDMNRFSRHGPDGSKEKYGYTDDKIRELMKKYNVLNEIIDKKGQYTTPDTVFYRGLGKYSGRDALKLETGDLYEDNGFQSFSTSSKTASDFAINILDYKPKQRSQRVVIRAIMTGKQKGIAGTSYESELIIKPGTKWTVVNKETIDTGKLSDSIFHIVTVIGEA